jgi:putative restriction endonuclease
MRAASRGKPWLRDELIVVCNLYFSLPFGKMHARNPAVITMAKALDRTPGSVAMKLVNFASLDPAHHARGISGLTGISRADKEVWGEFQANWSTMANESEERLTKLLPVRTAQPEKQRRAMLPIMPPPEWPTEATATVRVRRAQSFFRKVVLAAYEWRCCITGNPVPELLIASHILPWSEFPKERVNPCNGLCLAAHFDRAFDQGLISFGEDAKLMLSSQLLAHLPDKAIEREFISLEGTQLRTPERFPPEGAFLDYHRRNIFQP